MRLRWEPSKEAMERGTEATGLDRDRAPGSVRIATVAVPPQPECDRDVVGALDVRWAIHHRIRAEARRGAGLDAGQAARGIGRHAHSCS